MKEFSVIQSAILISLSFLIYGFVHSLLASLWAKGRARQWFGPSTDRWYRLAYNIFATVSLLPVLALVALLPDRSIYTVPSPWFFFFLAGQFLAAIAILMGLWHTGVWSFFGLRQLVDPNPRVSTELVVRGLYRWVRHPLYTAGLALIWLSPVMSVNILVFNIGATVYLVVGALFEERKLLREFGTAYANYQAKTPMLIPGLGRSRAGESRKSGANWLD